MPRKGFDFKPRKGLIDWNLRMCIIQNSPPSGSPPSPLNGFMEWIHVLNLGWEVDLDVLFDVVRIVIVM